jgi:N-acetylmuramoyl-L-alanine amidase
MFNALASTHCFVLQLRAFLVVLALTLTAQAQVHAEELATNSAPFVVMLDPGHGGIDTGAVRGSLKESEIALRVSLRLAELLKENPHFRVELTRKTDQALTLDERTSLAKQEKIDLFLSIHLNSSNDPRAQGKEFYFQNQLPVDEESMFLVSRENAENLTDGRADGHSDAHAGQEGRSEPEKHKPSEGLSSKSDIKRILEDLSRNERIKASSELSQVLYETWISSGKPRKKGSRAIRQAPFYVVSNVPAPSVLVELGFLSHPLEGPRLAQASYQEELAKSLYTGLVKFKETVDKDRARALKSADAL